MHVHTSDQPALSLGFEGYTYDLRRFSGATIMDVLRTHRLTVSRGVVVENPYYDPRGWLAQHAPDLPPLDA